jgi:hypothetical protein
LGNKIWGLYGLIKLYYGAVAENAAFYVYPRRRQIRSEIAEVIQRAIRNTISAA